MDNSQWLLSLKKDDEVFVTQQHGVPTCGKVSRKTKASIFVVTGKNFVGEVIESRFNNRGQSVGTGSYNTQCLLEPTQELRDGLLKKQLRFKANSLLDKIVFPDTIEGLTVFIDLLQKYVTTPIK